MMKEHPISAVVVVVIVLISLFSVDCQPIKPPTTTFVYYLFALQWPPSICDSYIQCREGIPTYFTIHGLWPQNGQNRVPPYAKSSNCTTLTVVPARRLRATLGKGNLEGPLTQVWPDLKNTSDINLHRIFWRNKWSSHGMCSDYGNNPIAYFRAAIDLRNNVVSVLKFKSGGVASKAIDISTTIQAQLGKIPQIHCLRSRTTNKLLLGELRQAQQTCISWHVKRRIPKLLKDITWPVAESQ
ncbi:hypothetical protein V6N13_064474 [Hibiscus sabdariffa]